MKKLLTTVLTMVLLFAVVSTQAEASNVGDGQPYDYLIYYVGDGEIHGVPLNKKSADNKGILLFEEEVSFKVQPGDHIRVVWGEEEDEFASIKRIATRYSDIRKACKRK